LPLSAPAVLLGFSLWADVQEPGRRVGGGPFLSLGRLDPTGWVEPAIQQVRFSASDLYVRPGARVREVGFGLARPALGRPSVFDVAGLLLVTLTCLVFLRE